MKMDLSLDLEIPICEHALPAVHVSSVIVGVRRDQLTTWQRQQEGILIPSLKLQKSLIFHVRLSPDKFFGFLKEKQNA